MTARATFLLLLVLLWAAPAQAGNIVAGEITGEHELTLALAAPLDAAVDWRGRVGVVERENPDVPLTVTTAALSPDGRELVLTLAEPVSSQGAYAVTLCAGPDGAAESFQVRKGVLAVLFSILISAALIQNFVFSRYLGLCIFFGASGRKETAVGMGFSFILVMTLSAVFVWAMYNFVLKPLHLQFLQVLTFVGIIAIFVQLLDTVLRKVNPFLFKKLGVYLVLITTNCIILAVPLILVDNAYDLWESLALALGSGAGFALALFLMACVRERLELADIPEPFRGLPIAFVVAGLFALAFLGFSGMSF
ncbi:electron transport complex protein RnfA [Desulfovibrio aminophilus]|uniref:electron transport complex protein RnfA n=1 Tax=Desulfovibrio aminophilus TaxID=81425 RepID=UPI0003FD760A|nr:Rnf-Nqr domain containing protein [Desulfovibrio aminophilus]